MRSLACRPSSRGDNTFKRRRSSESGSLETWRDMGRWLTYRTFALAGGYIEATKSRTYIQLYLAPTTAYIRDLLILPVNGYFILFRECAVSSLDTNEFYIIKIGKRRVSFCVCVKIYCIKNFLKVFPVENYSTLYCRVKKKKRMRDFCVLRAATRIKKRNSVNSQPTSNLIGPKPFGGSGGFSSLSSTPTLNSGSSTLPRPQSQTVTGEWILY